MSDKVSIEGLDKAEVLAALFNGARTQGLGFLQPSSGAMETPEARELLKRGAGFDYLKGRVLKVNLSEDNFDPWGYDRDNGQGAAEGVVTALRTTGMVNPEETELQHLEGTRNAAKEVSDNLGIKSGSRGEGEYELGFGDFADELKPRLDEVLGDEDED